MKTNLSSQITLDRVSPRYYRPGGNIERSVLTRFEKLPTDIYATAEEGALDVALKIAATIRLRQREIRACTICLSGGATMTEVFNQLVRMHEEERLSFSNVVVFVAYEYYPLPADSVQSNLKILNISLGFLQSPINAGAFCMIAGLVLVPLVSLVSKAPDKAAVDAIFSCYERKVTVTAKDSIETEE